MSENKVSAGRMPSKIASVIPIVVLLVIMITNYVTKNKFGYCDGFEVEIGGDTELTTVIMALKFIVKVLEDQSKEVWD